VVQGQGHQPVQDRTPRTVQLMVVVVVVVVVVQQEETSTHKLQYSNALHAQQ